MQILIQAGENKLKTFDFLEAYDFIISQETKDIKTVVDFAHVNKTDFAKIFLCQTKDVEKYIDIEMKLNETKTIYEYGKKAY